jgi:DNA-binding transcriptional MerR regulator
VSRIAGVSLRQLQWWDERRVIPVRHEGHHRVYEVMDVVQVCVLGEMRRKGLSLQVIRKALRRLSSDLSGRIGEVWPLGSLWLVVNAGSAWTRSLRGERKFIQRGEILALTNSREDLAEVVVSHSGAVVVISISAQAWKAAA